MVKDKPEKTEGGQKKSIEDSYWSAASEDEKRRREGVSSARARRLAEAAIKKPAEQAAETETPAAAAAAEAPAAPAAEASAESTTPEGTAEDGSAAAAVPVSSAPPKQKKMSANEMEFWQFAARERDEYENETAEANDPCFSVRAQQAAWQLHKSNPEKWNAARLSNLFRVSLDYMRLALWESKMEDQAEKEGQYLDDSVDRALEQYYGALDFPDTISEIPDRIRWKTKRNAWFFIDDEISSGQALKALKTRDLTHLRESPRLPKQPIPPMQTLTQKVPAVGKQKVYPGRYKGKFYLWDISKSKNLYDRKIVVRDEDGSLRTANWQERRWVEDYRRFLKYPVISPVPTPDETQRDHVPSTARVDAGEALSIPRLLEEAENVLQNRREKYWNNVMTREKFDELVALMKRETPLSVPLDPLDYTMAREAATAPYDDSYALDADEEEEDVEEGEEAETKPASAQQQN